MQNKFETILLGIVLSTSGCAAHVQPAGGTETKSLPAASSPPSRTCAPDVIDASVTGGHDRLQGGYHLNVTLTHKRAGVTIEGLQKTVTYRGANNRTRARVKTYETWMNSEELRADLAIFELGNGSITMEWEARIFVKDDPNQLDLCELVKTGVF